MPVRKTMDPSLSKNSSSISTETNNQKNPSSANKNVLKSVSASMLVNGENRVRKSRDNSGKNGTTVAKNRPPKNNNSTSTSTVKSATPAQPKAQRVKKAVVLAEGEEEVPKLSRRLKIQNKLEKRMKAAEEGGEGAGAGGGSVGGGVVGSAGAIQSSTSTTSSASASVSMTSTETAPVSSNTVQQVRKFILLTPDMITCSLILVLQNTT